MPVVDHWHDLRKSIHRNPGFSVNNLNAASHLATVKNVFSLDLSFSDLLPDGLSHFMLVAVDKGTINMAVTSINGNLHRLQTGTFRSLMGEEKNSFSPLLAALAML